MTNRSKGQILGFLFGIVGLIAVVVMTQPERAASPEERPEWVPSGGFWSTNRSYWIIVGAIAFVFLVAYLVSSNWK